jgi:tetratricopeptide (TPR) repeat protein
MMVQGDPGALLERARKYERQGRSAEAAAAFAEAAGAMEARGEWPAAAAARARYARALAAAGDVAKAQRVVDTLDRGASSLPAEVRAGLDAQAAHVLAAAGRTGEAARRAWAAMSAFGALQDAKRSGAAGVHAARLILRDARPRDALRPLRELLAQMPPGGDGHRQVAALLAEAERRPDRDHDVLITDPDSAPWGRLAAALAVGAHLAVGNGTPWNALRGEPGDKELLERDWGVTDAEGWREQMDALLDASNSDPAIQMVLDQRERGTGEREWRAAIVAWCGERDIGEETVREVVALSGAILRYEARFRADGLLPPDGRVESVYGYDFGRAVNMARWGLAAGYCDADEAEKCVLTAGHRAHQVYTSWGSFSAGYVLGRMLRFDEGEFGEWYDRSLVGHRILAEDPGSPWRRMAWG